MDINRVCIYAKACYIRMLNLTYLVGNGEQEAFKKARCIQEFWLGSAESLIGTYTCQEKLTSKNALPGLNTMLFIVLP